MRRLLSATPGVTGIEVRTGEGVDWSGWDGSARTLNAPFLPSGSLKLELGVNKKVKAKADEDWDARSESASADEIFVFASPRRWPGAQDWAKTRRAEGRFADVFVIDADLLEGWLKKTPSTHYWLSERLGRRPRHAHSVEGWWRRFSSSTDPSLPLDMFVAGRGSHVAALRGFLAEQPRVTTIRSEWFGDALAFVCAALSADSAATFPVVIVDNPDVFASVAEEPAEVILVPTFQDADVAKAIDHGHHVLLVVDDTSAPRGSADITLPRVDRRGSADALQQRGLDFRLANQYAAQARRNMQAFVRSISRDMRFAHPEWAKPPLAALVARLCLAGSWTTSDADTALLESFVGISSDEVIDLLDQLSGADPVFRRVGRRWQLTSPREAFELLAPSLAGRPNVMQRWVTTVDSALSESDPVLDLPEDERQFAGLQDIHRRLSATMRQGMARGVVLVGVLGQDEQFMTSEGQRLSDYADELVARLLSAANSDETGRRWRELSDVLTLLAEAAPRTFLDGVQTDLDRATPTLLQLFDDGGSSHSSFGHTSPHTYLLWALETLCWSPEYLPDAVRMLATLAALDPGGRTENRPISSLSSVLCGWVNHTTATSAQRVEALRMLRAVEPQVCWRLTLALWPSAHATSMPPHYPYMQRWAIVDAKVLVQDWTAFVHELVDIALDLVREEPVRVGELVKLLSTTPENDQRKILAELGRVAANVGDLAPETRFELWRQLDSVVATHERFADTAWAYSPNQLAEIKAAAAKVELNGDPRRYSRLFDWHPDLPSVDDSDFDAYQERLAELRAQAMTDVLALPDPIGALQAMTLRAPAPGLVGAEMASHSSITLAGMISWLGSEHQALRIASTVWVGNKTRTVGGLIWLREALNDPNLQDTARERLLQALPITRPVWELVEERERDAELFWRTVTLAIGAPGEVEELVARLLEHQRAWAAIPVLSHEVHRNRDETGTPSAGLSTDLIVKTLFQAVGEEPRPADMTNMTSYSVGKLFDHLDAASIDEGVLARLEFAFYRLLEYTRQPRALNQALATDPELFVDLASRAYRGRDEKPRLLTEPEARLASQASWVLHSWDGFPGQTSAGTVDAAILTGWVQKARLLLSESGRTDIGDELIGQALAHAPAGEDGVWPAEPVRDVVELVGSNELENGLVIGRFNTRGVTTRGVYEGGNQERERAVRHRTWASQVKTKWPRTSRVLTSIAEDYERDAIREDARADIDADSD
jgi:hypothetical protein